MEQGKEGKVTFKISGRTCEGWYGESLLGALRRCGYQVPSLCYHEAVSTYGACRLCLVEVSKGKRRKLTTSCNFPVQDGIEVFLNTETVIKHRQMMLKLLLAMAPAAEEILALAAEHGVTETPFTPNQDHECVLCGLCNRVCKEAVGADAIGFSSRGLNKEMSSPYHEANEACIGCGACAYVCPTYCIDMKDSPTTRTIWGRTFHFHLCQLCQAPVITEEYRAYAIAHNGLPEDYYDFCESCKQRNASKRFAQVVW